jgi:uncharacterized protein YyaL (SSP411 family)
MDLAANRLAGETSPYLRQHAHNPVDWYPWNEEALERSRREDKPILLSVGYSACHWCHVMAHESFENAETASVMNEFFVNIKVDREERPDLDKIYQTAHYLLTQRSGGWPLTMFLSPDKVPFFGGTYFPSEPRHGLPAFKDLLHRVAELYRSHREDIARQNHSVLEVLQQVVPKANPDRAALNASPLDQARQELDTAYDRQLGGFGPAPKFPHPSSLERLLRHYAGTLAAGRSDEHALEMVHHTLTRMARGGIYDQIGGGFCRYSVDEHWMIPHFEKMLYDNGQLLALYADAWKLTGDSLFSRVCEETAGWVMREMESPEGGYYSALDADSEGEEGKFYVWSRGEVESLLDEEEYRLAAQHFGLDRPSNFEGHWHLYVVRTERQVAQTTDLGDARVAETLDGARRKLLAARDERVRPGCDDKVLTSWNALMIKGMSVAGRHFQRNDWVDSAERAIDFVRRHLWRNQRLLATYKDGVAHLPAYLDDYAFLVDALLEFAQARFRPADMDFAVQLADTLLGHFDDREHGGFYFTADDHEDLIQRPKPLADDATPAGNGVAAYALARLGHLLGEMRYLEAAERTLNGGWDSLVQAPHAHGAMLLALEEHLYPPQTVVLRGSPEVLAPWTERCHRGYTPRRLCLAIPADAEGLPGLLAERRPLEVVVAYLCTGHTCDAPITRLEELETALSGDRAHLQ